MSSSNKLTCKGTLRQVFICLSTPPLLGYCLGWSSNFVGSLSGQMQSVNFAEYGLQALNTPHSPPPSHSLSVCLYCILTLGREDGVGAGGEQERRLDGQ
jgi:hypothetical protein